MIILGSGPNRIGQGIEFDYCCCHASFALRDDGYETIMINCNPETVSTDYDTSDRLYFEPLTFEDVWAIYQHETSKGADVGVIVQFGGQTPLNLALPLKAARVKIIPARRRSRSTWRRSHKGTPTNCLKSCRFRRHRGSWLRRLKRRLRVRGALDMYPGVSAAFVCAGWARNGDCPRQKRRSSNI